MHARIVCMREEGVEEMMMKPLVETIAVKCIIRG